MVDKQSTPGFRILPQDGQTRKRLYSWGMASGPWAMRRTAGVLVRTSSTYSSAGRRRGRCSIFAMPTAPASRHLGRDRPKYWRIPCEIAASVSSTRAR